MARLAKGTRTPASEAAGSRPAACFSKGRAMPAKAASEVRAVALEAELRRLILAAQARRVCRLAGRPLHFEVPAEAGAGQEGAARRRKASRRFMACNACCAK